MLLKIAETLVNTTISILFFYIAKCNERKRVNFSVYFAGKINRKRGGEAPFGKNKLSN